MSLPAIIVHQFCCLSIGRIIQRRRRGQKMRMVERFDKLFITGKLHPLRNFNNLISRISINPPSNYNFRHSIANEWSILRWSDMTTFMEESVRNKWKGIRQIIQQGDKINKPYQNPKVEQTRTKESRWKKTLVDYDCVVIETAPESGDEKEAKNNSNWGHKLIKRILVTRVFREKSDALNEGRKEMSTS